ncbi:MAG: hypothetical protein H7832_06975 [Magnetococcus sp. DMHC-6]
MELIFNELSLSHLASTPTEARARVETFINTLRAAFQNGISRQLRTQEAFKESLLSEGYSWHDWLRDPAVSKENKLYFKGLATRAPFLDGLKEKQDLATGHEFYFADQPVDGLGAAFLTDGLAISLLSENKWDQPFIAIKILELQENGVLSEYNKNVHHASKPDHMTLDHRAWIQAWIKKSVATGEELWKKSPTYFPSLVFCPSVKEQMQHLQLSTVNKILRGLRCLENYCQTWTSGGFNQDKLRCLSSPESESTLNQFGQERTFNDPDGKSHLFSYHVKLGDSDRIYFNPDIGPGKILIGYIGPHLRTKRYN